MRTLRKLAFLLGLMLLPALAWAGGPVTITGTVTTASTAADVCQKGAAKTYVTLSGLAATTQIGAPTPGENWYVCDWSIQAASGTTPTVGFEYGTGTTCGTGTTVLIAPFNFDVSAYQIWNSPGGSQTKFSAGTADGNALCLTVGGTTPVINGIVTLVQAP